MGRLIDADAFKRRVAGMAISNNYPANKANAWCELIDEQPTAFDVDKVVKQWKIMQTKKCTIIKALRMKKCIEVCIGKAIEIVKGGGVDG